LTDAELIDASRAGDNNSFKEIVKRYESRVAATVIGMLGNCPEADDVGQETFIRFYQGLDKFRGEASVGTYLTRIAINLSLNELKRLKKNANCFRKTLLKSLLISLIQNHRNPMMEKKRLYIVPFKNWNPNSVPFLSYD